MENITKYLIKSTVKKSEVKAWEETVMLPTYEIEENYGIKTTAIVTMAEVVEHLYNREYKGRVIIDDTLKAAIDAYYDQYGVK